MSSPQAQQWTSTSPASHHMLLSTLTQAAKHQVIESNCTKAIMDAKALPKAKVRLLLDDSSEEAKVEFEGVKKEKGTLKNKGEDSKHGWESDEDDRAAKRRLKAKVCDNTKQRGLQDCYPKAQERIAIDDGYNGYMIPQDYLTDQGRLDKKIKHDASKKLYEESKQPAEAFVTDVDRYEEIQTQNGPTKLGQMDCQAQVAYYELLLDESATIAFLMDQDGRIGGTLSANYVAVMAPFDAAER
ncbi:hypothetical protein O181_096558 [Austropuccinia psidii MF-1]|uniref:Uncharacterized protein n=1 Tax=Austropuccinia psidii MF-1 TaxID=1389203 RepID=A0A9Q3J771_9BASI|nr:hypothetical protein [Austropuccinia psidii MF-1]